MINEKISGKILQIIEIAETQNGSDIFLNLKMIMFDTEINLNGCKYSKAFLDEIARNENGKYTGLPLVADIQKLQNGRYSELTHLQDKKSGDFKTAQIGSFYSFEINETENDVVQLIGYAKVPKRHKKVCAALLDLHEAGELKFSYEIAVSNYIVISNIKHIDADEQNYIIGLAIVSNPACLSSSSLLAASLDEIINEQGEPLMPQIKEPTIAELFKDCRYILSAEIDKEQIQQKLYKKLGLFLSDKLPGINAERGFYGYDIRYLFNEYVIIYDYSGGNFYKITYSVSGADIELTGFERVTIEFVVAQVRQVNDSKLTDKLTAVEAELTKVKNELAVKDNQIINIGEELTKAQTEIKKLLPYKEEAEKNETEKIKAETENKIKALKEKAQKVLTEDEMAELNDAINSLDESAVNAKLAAKYVAAAEKIKNTADIFAGQRITDKITLSPGESIFDRPRDEAN